MFKLMYVVLLLTFIYCVSSFGNANDKWNRKNRNTFETDPDDVPRDPAPVRSRFAREVLKAHNRYRTRHCVPPLQLDDDLSRFAQKHAQYLADIETLTTSGVEGVGVNLYMKTSSAALGYTAGTEPTDSWYQGIRQYDFDDGGFSMQTGYFTQLVWKSSKLLGVGIAYTNDRRSVFIVAFYSPTGNYAGEYQNNVFPGRC